MKQILGIIIILFIVGVFLSGGIDTKNPQRLLTGNDIIQLSAPSNTPTAGNELQLQKQSVASVLHPSPSVPNTTVPSNNPSTPNNPGTPANPTITNSPSPQPSASVYDPYNCQGPSHDDQFVYDCAECCGGACTDANAYHTNGLTQGPGSYAPFFCEAKPAIFLYPEKPSLIDVSIEAPGKITISIPEYGDGWKGILAYPDGSLFYQGDKYPELFYEVALDRQEPPKTGVIVARKDIKPTLLKLGKQLGFNNTENTEFVEYWTDRLNKNIKSPFIQISFWDPIAKQKLDKVIITPKPDVFIQYIFYFKEVTIPYSIMPPAIPEAPVRQGFAAVEWGGVIDQ